MTIKIGVIPGDGIGEEVIRQGVKILNCLAQKYRLQLELETFDLGAERYLRTGELLPPGVLSKLETFDSIYLGALGDPRIKPGIIEQGILLKIRFHFDQYINLRPVKLFADKFTPLKNKGVQDINFTVFRENSEGIYTGIGGVFKPGTKDEVAIQEMVATHKGVERIIRFAFDFAQQNGKVPKVTICDKSNVLTYAHGLWQRVFKEIALEYPRVQTDHYYIDALVMKMVRNPETFDVIVTENMFGDIITDLGAELQGGLGLAASGNINPHGLSMFEPIHGSAPDIAGKNIASPFAAIQAVGMMMTHLKFPELGILIEEAVKKSLNNNFCTPDLGGTFSTDEVGDYLVEIIKNS